jgi:hypothetical protein
MNSSSAPAASGLSAAVFFKKKWFSAAALKGKNCSIRFVVPSAADKIYVVAVNIEIVGAKQAIYVTMFRCKAVTLAQCSVCIS